MMKNQNSPTISFIVPAYNVEEYLPRCVDSILAQTFTDFELLLIDDGSTDHSGEICDEYAAEDSRVKVIHQENGGVSAARNVGLDLAQGKYYIFCDSDDMLSPNLAEQGIQAIEENSLDCFVYGYKCVNEGFDNPSIAKRAEIEIMDTYTALEAALLGQKFRMLACNKIYASYLWDMIRFPVGRAYGDDTSVTYRTLDAAKRIGYTPTVFYYYRMQSGSALHRTLTTANLQLFDAYDELISYFKNNHKCLLSTAYYAYCVRVFDFLARVKGEQGNAHRYVYIKELQRRVKKHFLGLLSAPRVTWKQKALMCVLWFSPRLFWEIYNFRRSILWI